MATTSVGVYLMYKKTSAYEKLVDIRDYPDMGSDPEMIDVTTLSDLFKKYEPGVQDTGALKFSMNFTKEEFTKVTAIEGVKTDFALYIGGTKTAGVLTPDGNKGKVKWSGTLSAYINGAGVSESINATIVIAVSSEIVFGDT